MTAWSASKHSLSRSQFETNLSQLARGETGGWRERLMAELDGREEGSVQNGELVSGMPQSPTLVDAGHYRER